MSSHASLRSKEREEDRRGFRKMKQDFKREFSMMQTQKRKYFFLQIMRLVKIARSGQFEVNEDELKRILLVYIETGNLPDLDQYIDKPMVTTPPVDPQPTEKVQ